MEAESSLLVDVFHHPHLLFTKGSENRERAENGGFIAKYDFLLSSEFCRVLKLELMNFQRDKAARGIGIYFFE